MSIANRGKSTIWDAKTKRKDVKKKAKVKDIRRLVDEGYRLFWSKRKVGPYGT